MAAVRSPALLALGAFLAASPALADASGPGSRHSAPRHLTVRRERATDLRPAAATFGVAVAPGFVFATPFTVVAGLPDRVVRVPHYIGPDGTYDEYADLVKSINGTPCGQDCTQRSLERWGYAAVDGSEPRPR